ncbi:phospholipase A2 inhibitor and Ly6/PLAUR domain-containing protein-like [Discoglossus pictus]
MGFFLIFTCILSALAAKGYSLSCTKCLTYNGDSCVGPTVLCPYEEDSCVSMYAVTSIDGKVVSKIFSRQCAKHNVCNKYASVSLSNSQIKTSSSCCFTDNCSPDTPKIAPDNPTKNGVSCMTCTDTNSKSCIGMEMECTGDETKCFTQITTISAPRPSTVVVRGCSNEALCYIGNQEAEVGSLKVKTEISCDDGNRHGLWHKLTKLHKPTIYTI